MPRVILNPGVSHRHGRTAAERLEDYNAQYDGVASVYGWTRTSDYAGFNKPLFFTCSRGHTVETTPSYLNLRKPHCPTCAAEDKISQWNIIARQRGYSAVDDSVKTLGHLKFECDTCGAYSNRQRWEIEAWHACKECKAAGHENSELWVAEENPEYGDHAILFVGRLPSYLSVIEDKLTIYPAFHRDKTALTEEEGNWLRFKSRTRKHALMEKAALLLSGEIGEVYTGVESLKVLNTEQNHMFQGWVDGLPTYTFELDHESPLTRALLDLKDGGEEDD